MGNDLPNKRHRRNVERTCIKQIYANRYGVWIPGDMHPVAEIVVHDADDTLTLEIRQNGLGSRMAIRPEVSNVIKVEMARE